MSVRHDEGVASAGYGGSGANEFTFSGAGTTITFFPATPGPVVAGHEGGELHYRPSLPAQAPFGTNLGATRHNAVYLEGREGRRHFWRPLEPLAEHGRGAGS